MRDGAQVNQVQRRADLAKALGRDVEVARGGEQAGVTQEPLHDGQFDAVFDAVRGEGMTQNVDAALAAHATVFTAR